MRSLRTKLILMTLITGVAGVILTGFWVRFMTLREFDRLRLEQARATYTDEVVRYYQQYGMLNDFRPQQIRQEPRPPADTPREAARPPGERPGGNRNDGPGAGPPMFILIDENGRTRHGAGNIPPGRRLPPDAISTTTPLRVDGEIIGYVALIGGAAQFTQQELAYLQRTSRALIIGATGGATLSVLLGIVMARYLLHPLRELTNALRTVDMKGPGHQLTVRTDDELGELTASFNRMSASLDRANRLREQMTADIAHDLRTPMTVISGYLEGLRDGTLQPTQRRFDTMHDEARYLIDLIEDLR
ncbi:MAG: histidine kinase dimerization/phospho-acceptor domain-containing protein, partial [Chloroflexota bacterium]